MNIPPPVPESRKKLFAWTELLTSVLVDATAAPITRMRTLWVCAPLFAAAGIVKFSGDENPISYSAVWALAGAKGNFQLLLPAAALAIISILKKTRTFDKLVEKPMVKTLTVLQPKEGENGLVSFLKKMAAPTMRAAILMLVEYPFQTVMYRMATDTTSTSIAGSFCKAMGFHQGGLAGMQTLYIGYDATVYGVVAGALIMALGETSKSTVLERGSGLFAGFASLFSDGLGLRMAATFTWSPFEAHRLVATHEGNFWFLRGLPFLFLENMYPVLVNGIRSNLVKKIFSDVIEESENAQQAQIQALLAQMKAQQQEQEEQMHAIGESTPEVAEASKKND